eukprot:gb/GECH01010871.1/.p1 GENE.gb/GECH01010871.1/~~gb/GECH01010871.1/.p1  ORF type:complete len:285 (+),score=23.02 gb/GECH01010871.1/:1-855(+)
MFFLDQKIDAENEIMSFAAMGAVFMAPASEEQSGYTSWQGTHTQTVNRLPRFYAYAPTVYMKSLITESSFPDSVKQELLQLYKMPATSTSGFAGERFFAAMLCMRLTLFDMETLALSQLFPLAEIHIANNKLEVKGKVTQLRKDEDQFLSKKQGELLVNSDGFDTTGNNFVLCGNNTYGLDGTIVLETVGENQLPILLVVQTKFGTSHKYFSLDNTVVAVNKLIAAYKGKYDVICCIAVKGHIGKLDRVKRELKGHLILYYNYAEHSVANFFPSVGYRIESCIQ